METESALTFADIFKESVLESGVFAASLTLEKFLASTWNVLLALLLGLMIYLIYRATFRGVVYSQTFAISLIAMTVLTAGIIVTISSNVVLSLGMVGALSIVRYRTAIKDPLDLMYLFWTVSAGIAAGAGLFYIALLVSAIMIGLLLVLQRRKGPRDEVYVLIIHYQGADIGSQVRAALGACRYQIKSRTARGEQVEMAVEVRVKHHDMAFAERIQALPGVTDVTLVQYDGDYIS